VTVTVIREGEAIAAGDNSENSNKGATGVKVKAYEGGKV